MLASVYSYRVMVKSVSSCCVRGRRVLSNPVTNYYQSVAINHNQLLPSQMFFIAHAQLEHALYACVKYAPTWY